jgi:hypothetical protein
MRANDKKMAPGGRSHLIVQLSHVAIVVAIPMLLDDDHFVVIAVSVPATILIPVPVATFDNDRGSLSLSR